jgi:hypothetical protein
MPRWRDQQRGICIDGLGVKAGAKHNLGLIVEGDVGSGLSVTVWQPITPLGQLVWACGKRRKGRSGWRAAVLSAQG